MFCSGLLVQTQRFGEDGIMDSHTERFGEDGIMVADTERFGEDVKKT